MNRTAFRPAPRIPSGERHDSESAIPRTTTISKTPAATLEAITHWYGPRRVGFLGRGVPTEPVLKDITLSFSSHSVNAILGLNGAGKSTLLKILSGVMAPKAGAVMLEDRPIKPGHRSVKKAIGLAIGTRSRLIWDLPPIETFRLHRAIYAIDAGNFGRTMAEVEEIFAIRDFIFRPTRSLSLGQRVRVEVALAMIHRPRLLLLDECSIGLDLMAKEAYHAAISHIAKDWGTCVVQATNDLADIRAGIAKIAILAHNRIVFDGSFRDLTTVPGFSRTATVECDEAEVGPLVARLSAHGIAAEPDRNGALRIRADGLEDLNACVLDCVRESAPSVRSIRFGTEDLKYILAELETRASQDGD